MGKYASISRFTNSFVKDWELKLDLISDQALREDITNITGVCSWVLVLLNKILEKSGAENIQEVWPNLELYMHGGLTLVLIKISLRN